MLVSQPLPSKTGCGQAVFFIILLLQLCSRNAENEFFKLQTTEYIDNHDSGYLGMAVQLYVQAHLGHYHILTQKEYSLMAQLKSTPLLPIYAYCGNLNF